MGGIQSYFALEPYIAINANHLRDTVMKYYLNLASGRLGASVIDASDDFYGSAERLIDDTDPIQAPDNDDEEQQEKRDGQNDGWQTRRHIESASVSVQLGAHGRIYGVDIDTSGFISGAPVTATVEGLQHHPGDVAVWDTILDHVPIKPNAHNYFLLRSATPVYTKARLTVSPGGGVARFRCYGEAVPIWPKHFHRHVNLASAHNGANIISWTDVKYANKPNILVDGGKCAEDGWETPRSRKEPRNDFVVIQLGSPGTLSTIAINTAHFVGNAPQAISVDGCYSKEENPEYDYGVAWSEILRAEPVNPDTEIKFPISTDQVFTHLRLTIHPDGGIQQFSAYGLPFLEDQTTSIVQPASELLSQPAAISSSPSSTPSDSPELSPLSPQPVVTTSPVKRKRQRVAAEKAAAIIKEANVIVERKKRRT